MENYGKRIKEIQRKSIFGSSKREVRVGESSVIFGTSSLSFFLYNDRLAPSLMSKVIYKASYWDCSEFYIGKTKRRLRYQKSEHYKASSSSNIRELKQL